MCKAALPAVDPVRRIAMLARDMQAGLIIVNRNHQIAVSKHSHDALSAWGDLLSGSFFIIERTAPSSALDAISLFLLFTCGPTWKMASPVSRVGLFSNFYRRLGRHAPGIALLVSLGQVQLRLRARVQIYRW